MRGAVKILKFTAFASVLEPLKLFFNRTFLFFRAVRGGRWTAGSGRQKFYRGSVVVAEVAMIAEFYPKAVSDRISQLG